MNTENYYEVIDEELFKNISKWRKEGACCCT
jgi:hypothetical protein